MRDDLSASLALARTIAPILAGHPPGVQGAALADLLATWLAGHIAPTRTESLKLRDELIALHIATVRKLAEVADGIVAKRRNGA